MIFMIASGVFMGVLALVLLVGVLSVLSDVARAPGVFFESWGPFLIGITLYGLLIWNSFQ